jgi:ADP-ribosylation factor-like protein 1
MFPPLPELQLIHTLGFRFVFPAVTKQLVTELSTGGQTSIRPYWRCYYANTAAVVFVVDATDHSRLETAAEELSAMLNEEELQDAALLVFANKQDQPGVLGAAEISEALKLPSLKERSWSIFGCSAVTGEGKFCPWGLVVQIELTGVVGVTDGMDWLVV